MLGRTLSRCVDDLPAQAARVFTLTEVDGMSSKDICNTLGLSPTNLRVTLYRARLALRRCLERHGFGRDGVKANA